MYLEIAEFNCFKSELLVKIKIIEKIYNLIYYK